MKPTKKLLAVTAITAALCGASSYGAVTINLVGDGTDYDATAAQTAAWRSTDVAKGTLAVQTANAFGASGSWFVGNGTTNGGANTADNSPAWATTFVRGGTANIANVNLQTIDNPNLAIAPTVDNWAVGAVMGGDFGNAGAWGTLLTFNITASTPNQFRLGIMSGLVTGTEGWQPTGLRLSFGAETEEVTLLPNALGMVFFDIDVTDSTIGTFTIQGQQRLNTQGSTLAGITFDVVPEPSSSALLLGSLGLLMFRRRRTA